MTVLLYISVILLVLMCFFLILLVLIQKGRGGGLASAFGGGGGNTAFGSKTGDVLTWATSIVFGIFLILAIVTNLTANSVHAGRTAKLPAAAGQTAPNSGMPMNSGAPVPTTPEPAAPEATPSSQPAP